MARVLAPGGQLFIYTRTPQQNARTVWGRYFPGFTEHEQRLHSKAAFRDAVRRTGGLTVVATQTFSHPRESTAERLQAQAEGRHYSTFSFYTPEELRASTAAFLARLPSPEVCWVDEHLLVVACGANACTPRRPGQPGEPGDQRSGPPDQRRARLRGSHRGVLAAARRSPRYAPSPSLATTFGRAPRSAVLRAGDHQGAATLRHRWRLQPGAWQGVSGPATRRQWYVRRLRDRLPGCDAEYFGMSPAIVLRQDLTEVARPVRDGAAADLAAGDR